MLHVAIAQSSFSGIVILLSISDMYPLSVMQETSLLATPVDILVTEFSTEPGQLLLSAPPEVHPSVLAYSRCHEIKPPTSATVTETESLQNNCCLLPTVILWNRWSTMTRSLKVSSQRSHAAKQVAVTMVLCQR